MSEVQREWQKHYEQQWQLILASQLDRLGHSITQYGKQQLLLLEDESYVSKLEVVNKKIQQWSLID